VEGWAAVVKVVQEEMEGREETKGRYLQTLEKSK
jgi:hypothetical protein